jgi:ubiquinone/menaquinone biosynthesis C-methylase UbiE
MNDGARFFDEAAPGYDLGCRRIVPDLDGFYSAVVRDLPFGRDEELRVLDLGAGTGLLSATVAEKFPAAKITLVDLSVEMLRLARRRFADEPGRFEFRVMDYAGEQLPEETRGFDLVVSALSLHHLTHGDKRETFENVHASLASGGRFVNADRVQERRRRPSWTTTSTTGGTTTRLTRSLPRKVRRPRPAHEGGRGSHPARADGVAPRGRVRGGGVLLRK